MAEMQQINSTTFQAPGLGDVKPVVTIGGSAKNKFLPNVNNSFHDDEFFFNLNAVDDIVTDETATETSGVISQEISGSTHEYYIDDSGRLKWDKLFYSCPENMRVRFKVCKSVGVSFYYQGELTAEEIADGCERPDDIVGSYAVYCDKANNNYKTGKLCHIPCPFVIDASGNREWCVMLYTEINDTSGWLDITLPAEFMRSADYSVGAVRLDPTIGYTTAGASDSGYNFMMVQLRNTTAASSGTLSKIYAYLRNTGTSALCHLGVYNDNSGVPGALLAGPTQLTVSNTDIEWLSVNASGSISSSGVYYPACKSNVPDGNNNRIGYDSLSGTNSRYSSGDMVDNPTMSTDTWCYSIYLEYTESGGSTGGLLVGASALVGGGVLCGQGNLIN